MNTQQSILFDDIPITLQGERGTNIINLCLKGSQSLGQIKHTNDRIEFKIKYMLNFRFKVLRTCIIPELIKGLLSATAFSVCLFIYP